MSPTDFIIREKDADSAWIAVGVDIKLRVNIKIAKKANILLRMLISLLKFLNYILRIFMIFIRFYLLKA